MDFVDRKDIELLLGELGEYGETLGILDEISAAVFDVLEKSKNDKIDENEYKKWVINLKEIERFSGLNNIISDNVYSHQIRLSEFVDELSFFLDILNNNDSNTYINIGYLSTLALIHDDVEGVSIFKDIPTIIKMALSEQSKKILSIIDESCIELLSKHQNNHLKFYTSEQLKAFYLDSENKITLEGQLLSYLDKVDGFLFSLHELFNGNREFIVPFNNYIKILKDIKGNKLKYPKIRFLLDGNIDEFKNLVLNEDDFDETDESSYDKMYHKKNENRSSNVLEFFNIDKLLNIQNNIEEIIKTEIIDKKEQYELLSDVDGIFLDFIPEVITTDIKAYESWKITFAKMNYVNKEGNQIYGYDVMYT